VLEEMRRLLTDGKGNRRDLLWRPESGNASLGFHFHGGQEVTPKLTTFGPSEPRSPCNDYRVQSLIAGGPAHISGQINRGDVIVAVDNVEVTAKTMGSCFSSSKCIGSCASLRIKRESTETEVVLVRSSTSHLRNMQVLFGYLDALEKTILNSADGRELQIAFQKLLAYIIDMDRQRAENEMEVATQLAILQVRLVENINAIEYKLRPLPPKSDVHPRSSEPLSSKEDVSPLSTERAKSGVQNLQDPAKEASKKNIPGEDTPASDAQRLRNELTQTMQLLEDANVVVTLLDRTNKDLKLTLDQKKKQVEDLEEANAALAQDSTRVSHYTELDDVRKKLLHVESEYDELLQEFADSGLSDPAHVDSLLLAIKGPPAISPDVLVNVINVLRRFQVSVKDVESMVRQLQNRNEVELLNRIEVEQLQNRIEQLQQELLDVKQHDAFMSKLAEELQENLRGSQAEKVANVYEQRVENLQYENDNLRRQTLMHQIEVDQLKYELAHLDSLANTELESQRKALNAQIETLREDNRKLAENQVLHDSAVGKSDLDNALIEVDVDVIL
jgi:hypothetical protein